jgi:acetyl esterase/lipase
MKRFLFAFPLFLILALPPIVPAADAPKFTRTPDVVYGHKFGMALTFDVFQPEKPNSAAVFFMVSGGFVSRHEIISDRFFRPLLERGYTVFAVTHGSQPKFHIPEIQQDIHRAVRFARKEAARWKVDPNKFGISGISSGGHLSLTMGTQGGPGAPEARDPIERESSAVQAVACFCPPTDFLNWGAANVDAVGVGPLEKFKPAFGPESDTADGRQKLGKQISPVHYVTAKMAPTLILHGDADKLVPIQQARLFEKRCQELGAPFKLIVREGRDHGWPEMAKEDMGVCADWFDEQLLKVKKQPAVAPPAAP